MLQEAFNVAQQPGAAGLAHDSRGDPFSGDVYHSALWDSKTPDQIIESWRHDS
jgi:hypothetical protein